jgi:hypothetical protein
MTLASVFVAALFCAQPAASRAAPPAEGQEKTELNFVPILGGDSDVGVGAGVVGDLAHLRPGSDPFVWRLEGGAFITVKPGDGMDKLRSPYQDFYLELAVPELTDSRRLRLEVRPSYTVETTQSFYGVGNASPRPPDDLPDQFSQYERRRAAVTASARVRVAGPLYVRLFGEYSRMALAIPAGGLLAQERERGPDEVRALLDGPTSFGLAAAQLGVEYDTRDNEIVTRTGAYHELRMRVSPRFGRSEPYQFAQANATLRLYRAPLRWLELAGRVMGDVLFGDPPFYELTRIADISVVGGSRGIRGVPGQRYYGKVKVLGNLEARAAMWRGTLLGKPFALAGAGFVDAGRVWADLRSHPDLDGTGLGLKYGVGGGLRVQEGQTFVVRIDLAWSPDAQPVAAYFAAGETF